MCECRRRRVKWVGQLRHNSGAVGVSHLNLCVLLHMWFAVEICRTPEDRNGGVLSDWTRLLTHRRSGTLGMERWRVKTRPPDSLVSSSHARNMFDCAGHETSVCNT